MTYILLLISLSTTGNFETETMQTFNKMDDCFEGREILVKSIGRPIINYQAICIIKE